MFDFTEGMNNRNNGKKSNFLAGAVSMLFKPGNDSKKKKEKDRILEEHALDSILLNDDDDDEK